MKVIYHSPEQLVLRHTPWAFGFLVFAMIGIAMWLGITALEADNKLGAFWGLLGIPTVLVAYLLFFVRRDTVIFDKEENLIDLHHATFLYAIHTQIHMAQLERAMVQTKHSGEGGKTSRVALVLRDAKGPQRHPLTSKYHSGPKARVAVRAINHWLGHDIDFDDLTD